MSANPIGSYSGPRGETRPGGTFTDGQEAFRPRRRRGGDPGIFAQGVVEVRNPAQEEDLNRARAVCPEVSA